MRERKRARAVESDGRAWFRGRVTAKSRLSLEIVYPYMTPLISPSRHPLSLAAS